MLLYTNTDIPKDAMTGVPVSYGYYLHFVYVQKKKMNTAMLFNNKKYQTKVYSYVALTLWIEGVWVCLMDAACVHSITY
jgi:hypothetical protein